MNLIKTPWIKVRRLSGVEERIRPAQIASGGEADPVADILAPRPDFRGALYQFLIGLLQTTFAPGEIDDWKEHWDTPPTAEKLDKVFDAYAPAFELDGKEAAFMQDFKPADLSDSEQKNIGALLIDTPGEKSVKENKDHFIKRDAVNALCPCCAAVALFTLQINAPSGGAGHRVSLRGGGPLTTLLIPAQGHDTLWHNLWLNILPIDSFKQDALAKKHENLAATLPWLGVTRISAGKPAEETTPQDVDPLQAYWSMPRRIRLDFAHPQSGSCDVCGESGDYLISQYQTKNYGTNYGGQWLHPLTPYRFETLPISAKGSKARNGYRHWGSMILGGEKPEPVAAQVIANYHIQKFHKLNKMAARVWAFGFDMDNMKAECWYESTLPFVTHANGQIALQKKVQPLLEVAEEAAKLLNGAVRSAWGIDKSEPAVGQSLWQASESGFYAVLRDIAQAPDLVDVTLAPYYQKWLLLIYNAALHSFDEWVLSSAIEEQDMFDVIAARERLAKNLNMSKPVRDLRDRINPGLAVKKRIKKVEKKQVALASSEPIKLSSKGESKQ